MIQKLNSTGVRSSNLKFWLVLIIIFSLSSLDAQEQVKELVAGEGDVEFHLKGMDGRPFTLRGVNFNKLRCMISLEAVKKLPLECYGFDVHLAEMVDLEKFAQEEGERSFSHKIQVKLFQAVIRSAKDLLGNRGILVDIFKSLTIEDRSLYEITIAAYKKIYQEERSPEEMILVMLFFHPEFLYQMPLFINDGHAYNLRAILKTKMQNRLSQPQACAIDNFAVAGIYSYQGLHKVKLLERPKFLTNALQAYLNGFIALAYELHQIKGRDFFYQHLLEPVWSIKLQRNIDILPLRSVDVTIRSAVILDRKANGYKWDLGLTEGGKPDVYLTLYVKIKHLWYKYYQSPVAKNSFTPEWNYHIVGLFPLENSIKIVIYDRDRGQFDDKIGEKIFDNLAALKSCGTFGRVKNLLIVMPE